jgi:hypothetical protein
MNKNIHLKDDIILYKIFLLRNFNIYNVYIIDDIIDFIIEKFFNSGKVKIITLPDLREKYGYDSEGFCEYEDEDKDYIWKSISRGPIFKISFCSIQKINLVYTNCNRLIAVNLTCKVSGYSHQNYTIEIYTTVDKEIICAIYGLCMNKIYLYF